MTRWVALLRGINVGGNKKVPMAALRAALGGLGLRGVQTLLNSGNAVFTADDDAATLEPMLEKVIHDQLGQSVRCLVRERGEVRAVIDANPFPDAATVGSRYLAMFSSGQVVGDEADQIVRLDPDNIRTGDRVIYQWCRQGIAVAPDLTKFADKTLGLTVTGRNWNTVLKIAAALDGTC